MAPSLFRRDWSSAIAASAAALDSISSCSLAASNSASRASSAAANSA